MDRRGGEAEYEASSCSSKACTGTPVWILLPGPLKVSVGFVGCWYGFSLSKAVSVIISLGGGIGGGADLGTSIECRPPFGG